MQAPLLGTLVDHITKVDALALIHDVLQLLDGTRVHVVLLVPVVVLIHDVLELRVVLVGLGVALLGNSRRLALAVASSSRSSSRLSPPLSGFACAANRRRPSISMVVLLRSLHLPLASLASWPSKSLALRPRTGDAATSATLATSSS